MFNKIISDNTKSIMVKLGKAIEKGVGEDVRTYFANSGNVVNNAIIFLRGDYIATNIKNSLESESVEVKFFKRSSWTGCIVLDRVDKNSYSVCARKTLERIPKNRTRIKPHYLQTLVNIENKEEEARDRQMNLTEFGLSVESLFTKEQYENDFMSIMDDALSIADDYRHWIIAYEVEHNNLTSLSAILLDREFCVVEEIPLMDLMMPDFGRLTYADKCEGEAKDSHSLVTIKPGIIGRKASEKEMHTTIRPKAIEIKQDA